MEPASGAAAHTTHEADRVIAKVERNEPKLRGHVFADHGAKNAAPFRRTSTFSVNLLLSRRNWASSVASALLCAYAAAELAANSSRCQVLNRPVVTPSSTESRLLAL